MICFYKELIENDKYICHLKDHSQKLLAQIKKTKVTKQYNKRLEQEKEDVDEEFNKNQSIKDENSCLKNLN
jgi:hypothetical protein